MPGRYSSTPRLARSADNTLEGLYARHHQRGNPVYLTVVAVLVAIGAGLPFIYVNVGSQARAIVQTANPITEVAIGKGGKVVMTNLRNNRLVELGDTLLILDAGLANSESDHLTGEIERHHDATQDLELLLSTMQTEEFPHLRSAVYQQDYQEYRQQLDEVLMKEAFANRQLERQESLFATGTIAEMEIEKYRFDAEMARNAKRLLRERQQHTWTQELTRHKRELRKLRFDLQTLGLRSEALVITAPAAGNLIHTAPALPGSFLEAGSNITQISPEGDLELAVNVSPADIGLLRPGMPVNLEVDAFNRSRWGLARAEIREIARDISISPSGQPVFIVKCTLLDKELSLPSGHQGMLIKGMTATAHFVLARRSLFQLLKDRVEDWLPESIGTAK